MSAEDYLICPHCGKENLPQATRCIHCGKDLETIPETSDDFNEADGESLSELLQEIGEEGRQEASQPLVEEVKPVQEAVRNLPEEPKNTAQEEVPAWLAHIRERARSEGDARGMYNQQDLQEAARAIDARSAQAAQPYNSWVERVKESETAQSSVSGPEIKTNDEMPVWLKRVRDLQLRPDEDQIKKPAGIEAWKEEWSDADLEKLKKGELDEQKVLQPSLLDHQPQLEQAAETPKTAEDAEESTFDNASENEAVQADPEQKISENEPAPESGEPGSGDNSQVQQDVQVEKLKDILSDKSEPKPVHKTAPPHRPAWWRWIWFILLIAVLAIAYFFLKGYKAPAPLPTPAGSAFWSRVAQLQSGTLNIVLDYQAGMADEIEANALPVFKQLLNAGVSNFNVLALQTDGLWLGQELFSRAGLDDLKIDYRPGASLSFIAESAGKAAGNSLLNAVPAGWSENPVLLIADNSERTRLWLEQVGSWLKKDQVFLITTQASARVLQPYYDAGQLAGIQATPFDQLGQSPTDFTPMGHPAYEAGLGLLGIALLFSFVSKLSHPDKGEPEGRWH